MLAWGSTPSLVSAESDEIDSDPSNGIQVASVAEEADLSRSAGGETFEDDSHDGLHELSHESDKEAEGRGDREDRDRLESDHSREGDHEGPEGDSGIERDRGGGSETGGGDSGGDH